jgi:hypothetical protein
MLDRRSGGRNARRVQNKPRNSVTCSETPIGKIAYEVHTVKIDKPSSGMRLSLRFIELLLERPLKLHQFVGYQPHGERFSASTCGNRQKEIRRRISLMPEVSR